MASPDLIKGIAKELLDPANLPEAEAWLESRIELHMEKGDTEAIIRVGKLRDRVRATHAKLSGPERAKGTR